MILKIKNLTTCLYGLQLAPPGEGTTNENTAAVRQFLDNNFRHNIGLERRSNERITLSPSRLSEQLKIILEQKVPILSFAMSDPTIFVKQIHSAGAKVMSMIATVVSFLLTFCIIRAKCLHSRFGPLFYAYNNDLHL
jgi:hypothetical protein